MNSPRSQLRQTIAAGVIVAMSLFTQQALSQESQNSPTTEVSQDGQAEAAVRARQLELTAERLLVSRQAEQALIELAKIPTSQRSSNLQRLVNSALNELLTVKALSRPKDLPFSKPEVRRLITDPRLAEVVKKNHLAERFSEIAKRAAIDQDLGLLTVYFDLVIALRDDPDQANDELRFDIAHAATAPDVLEFARGRIEELNHASGLSYISRLRLLLSGFYGRTTMLAFSLLSVLTVSLIFLFLRRIQRVRQPESAKPQIRAHRGPAYAQPTEANDEYSELLRSFGLHDHASEEEIKAAYRRVIKSVHPDTSSVRTRDSLGGDGDLARQFMELKSKYERILEIRRGWFNR